MIVVTPPQVRIDATALAIYQGAPNVSIDWTLDGSGGLQPLSLVTDANGRAAAKYTPDTVGAVVTISARAGTA